LCNHELHDILFGIRTAIVEATKASKVAVNCTLNELETNSELHDGLRRSLILTAKIKLLSTAAIAVKTTTIYGAANGYAGILISPSVANGASDFAIGFLQPGPPPANAAGYAGSASRLAFDRYFSSF
jgi:hypothetical protein